MYHVYTCSFGSGLSVELQFPQHVNYEYQRADQTSVETGLIDVMFEVLQCVCC